MAKSKKKPTPTGVFVFKVALLNRKAIWRKLALTDVQTLDDLHAAIFHAFDRFDPHLYSFYFPTPGQKGAKAYRDAQEYTDAETVADHGGNAGFKLFDGGRPPERDAAKTRLGSLGLTVKQKFRYLFDFGDSWWHEITVEVIDGDVEKGNYPREVARKGASPAQYSNDEDDAWDDDF